MLLRLLCSLHGTYRWGGQVTVLSTQSVSLFPSLSRYFSVCFGSIGWQGWVGSLTQVLLDGSAGNSSGVVGVPERVHDMPPEQLTLIRVDRLNAVWMNTNHNPHLGSHGPYLPSSYLPSMHSV